MKSLEETIRCQAEKCEQELAVLSYLQELRDIQKTIFPVKQEDVVDYIGTRRIVKIDGEHYLIRRYLKPEDCWTAEKMKWDSENACWYNADDFDYLFDRYGKLIRKEG